MRQKCSDNDGSNDKSSKSDHQTELVHVELQLQALTTSVKELRDVQTVNESSKILDSINSRSPGSDSLTSQKSMEVLKYLFRLEDPDSWKIEILMIFKPFCRIAQTCQKRPNSERKVRSLPLPIQL